MKELLKDVLDIDGVNGVLILTNDGAIIFKEVAEKMAIEPETIDWKNFIDTIQEHREIELVYDKGLLYIRKIEFGFMLVLVEPYVQVAMIRLNCDIVLPSLQNLKTNKKFKNLFKK